jgi:bacillithiol biosynthesis deacetylase BshB2
MERERHILVVFPHPDDEVGVAATLARHIANGTPVTYVCLTLGEMGRNMGIPPFANRVSLPQIRKKELEESCRAIGITDLRMMGLHDKTVEFEDQEKLIERLGAIVAETNPSLVITFYPGYSVHPDHDACGAAVIKTIERIPADRRPKVYCVAFARGCEEVIGQPDIINEVGEFVEQKIGAFRAHISQTQYAWNGKSMDDLRATFKRERMWTYRFEQ